MKRKYADGGMVVSRGYDAGLGNIRLTDDLGNLSLREPAAARAAADMAINEEVSAPPPRRRAAAAPASRGNPPAARGTPPKPRPRATEAPTLSAQDRAQARSLINTRIDPNDKFRSRALQIQKNRGMFQSKLSMSQAMEMAKEEAARDALAAKGRREILAERAAMAARRKRNPDLFTQMMEAANPYEKAKGGLVKKPAYKNGGIVKKEKAEMMKKAAGKKAMPMAAKKTMPMAAMMKKATAKKPMKMAMGGMACMTTGKKK
jgi:hypothetical protein